MSDKLQWTQDLGNAVLAQQQDVTASIQRLRQMAQSSGTLQSNEQQTVTVQPAAAGTTTHTIIVEPAQPQTIYVPAYNPTVVYGTWPYPAYAAKDRNGDGLLAYAQKFRSSPGKRDGLYWPSKAGEELSPLGPLAARAAGEGYKKSGDKPQPYHGYYFRILAGQGKGASGGAYDYVVKKEMIGGFALLAWPAKYGVSGVMSFMLNHEGVVWQKDLGPKTASLAAKISRFDPADGWAKVEQK